MRANLLGGGCGTSKHIKWVQATGPTKHYFQVQPVRSSNENCGIAALVHYAVGSWMAPRDQPRYDTLRRELGIAKGIALSFDDLDLVARRLQTNYVVYDESGTRVHACDGYPQDGGRNAQLLLEHGHYSLILAQVGRCECGKPDGSSHTCRF